MNNTSWNPKLNACIDQKTFTDKARQDNMPIEIGDM